jgi:hypothetical protein
MRGFRVNKVFQELGALSWTLAGTGLVLITLAGDTRRMGIYISLAGLAVHLLGVFTQEEE